MSIHLINGDCLEVMKDLSANSIDCFICDLPYGQLSQQRKTPLLRLETETKEIKKLKCYGDGCSWDIKIDLEEFWKQVERLMKNDHTPILMFCNTKFGYELIKSKEDWFRYDLVWNKERGVSFLSANKMPMKSHEMIYVFSKKGAYYNRVDEMTDKKPFVRKEGVIKSNTYLSPTGTIEKQKNIIPVPLLERTDGKRCPLSVINIHGKVKQNQHPTEKPIELYKWLIERYCPPGGKLLDPTAGSCNSCFAGYELDRECIGIEMNNKFFTLAKKKVEELE
jgi:site-specific DNA-methyltransferase (adenine-specific)